MGILEQILGELQQLRQQVAGMSPNQQAAQQYLTPAQQQFAQPAQFVQQQPVQQPVQQYVQAAPAQQTAAYPPATEEQIMALITPHIGNQQVKDALGAAMRAMSIPALPEAKPHQYPELYQRFVAVLAQFGIGAQQAAPAQQAAATSII